MIGRSNHGAGGDVVKTEVFADGWLNEETGEFFHDMSDFKKSLRRIVDRSRKGLYHPRDWIESHAGTKIAGKKFRRFVEENFADRVRFPKGSKLLIPWGA